MASTRVAISYSEDHGTVSPKHVLYSEILSVTSAMRKNSRWASSTQTFNTRDSALASNLGLRRAGPSNAIATRPGSQEEELIAGFEELKRDLRNLSDISTIPIAQILSPFFAIIRSPLSTGPITSAALSALHSFFVCGLISSEKSSVDVALMELSSAVSHCKFEASDSSGDEVVLLRILTVIEDCMCGTLGERLGDIEVCEMLETVLTTCVQMRLSEALRRSAELTLHSLVRTVFYRLQHLDPQREEAKLARADESHVNEIDLSVAASPTTTVPDSPPDGKAVVETVQQVGSPAFRHAYGLPSLIELLRVIINILDPNDRVHTDTTRLLALGVLNTAFEVSGPRIGAFSSLRTMILDHGCKYLFQLARSDNPSIVHLALRTISTMINTMRKHLKLQQELFLSFTLDRLAPPISNKTSRFGTPIPRSGPFSPRVDASNTSSPRLEPHPDDGDPEKGSPAPHRPTVIPARGETRDLLLETLSQISPHPGFMVELFINYDCDINAENLFERLIELLSQGVYSEYYFETPHHASLSSQYLSLDLLLTFVNHMASRAAGSASAWPAQYISAEELTRRKSKKKLILTGTARFNTKPKTGLAFLEENELIYHDLGPGVTRAQSLAMFLKSSTMLDKKLLGDFISKPDNLDLLKAFISLFDFHGVRVSSHVSPIY
ncbi:Sec7-domain-containing protein [Auriscalpium vulgare]|uniref:Sec7-domain-containing protein n=1 Tax=Auriscalpium vulgare TaxID=40419 RepID=A0ACB8RW51_9AGAM|nr:Sec7-domain-containing protein [Auriscalpium vulgare]